MGKTTLNAWGSESSVIGYDGGNGNGQDGNKNVRRESNVMIDVEKWW